MDISMKKLKCSTCSKTFTNKACLRQHVLTHDPNAKVKCEICGKLSKNPASLASHKWRFHPNRKPHFLKHIKIEHAGNPVRFTVCGKALKKKAHLESHILTHSTKKPFKCTKCGRGFAHKSAQIRHGKVHLDKSTRELIRCQSCTRAYFTKDGLRHHIRIAHGNPQIYPCEFCDKRFSNSTDLKRHVDVIHSANKGKIYFCDKCKFSSRSEADLAAHHLSRHNDADGHECYFCGKQFFYFRQLVNHCGRIHTLEKFNCT